MTPTTTMEVPQRTDISTEDKWDLSTLYTTDSDWEADFAKAQKLAESAKRYVGKLASSATLFECLETRVELSRTCDRLYQYARLNQDLDNRVSKYQEMSDRAARLSADAGAAFSFVEPELLTLKDAELKAMADSFPKKDIHDLYIRELIRSRAHIRSADVEELLAQSLIMARSANNVFTMLDNADIKYPSIRDEAGNEVRLTKQRYTKFLESTEQRVRRDANDGFMSVYKDHANTFAAALSAQINKDAFYAKARKYQSSLAAALDGNNIPESVYRSLIETTESDLKGLHKFISLRKKILGLEHQYLYDLYCPLFPEQNYGVSYSDAVSTVMEAVRPLGKDYCSYLEKGFGSRWVDVWETEGKRGGAYSWGSYDSHPFVLMNYNETIHDMFTLAHEMGHALHSYLSNGHQPYTKAGYSIFVAEVASTLNEGLLLENLLKKTRDDKQRLFLLNRQLSNTQSTFFTQVFFAHFELEIHELVERGEALSPDTLNALWEKMSLQYFGPAVESDEFMKYRWTRIPHFYMNFYVYQYATSFAASQAILKKFLDGEKGIIEKYLELLKSGGNDYPIEQLKKCGIDMTTPEPVKATLELFASQIDQLERMAGV